MKMKNYKVRYEWNSRFIIEYVENKPRIDPPRRKDYDDDMKLFNMYELWNLNMK